MKKASSAGGRVAGWIIIFLIAALIFTFLLAVILNNAPLLRIVEYLSVPPLLALAIAISFISIRWLCCGRHLRPILLSLMGLCSLTALFYVEEDLRGWCEWHHFRRQAEAKGDQFDASSIIPPPVPDNRNFALAPVIASSYEGYLDKTGKKLSAPNTNVINRLAMDRENDDFGLSVTNYGYWARGRLTDLKEWQAFYRALATKTNEFAIPRQPQSPAADVLLALSKYDANIEAVRQAGALPDSRFPVDYNTDRPFDILLVHLSGLKRCSQVLELRAVAELEAGRGDDALSDVKLIFRLIESIRSEPFLITHLVRNAMTSIALQPVWEGLVKYEWSETQLAEIDRQLGNLNFLDDYQRCIHAERNGAIAQIESLRKHRDYHEIAFMFDVDLNFFLDGSRQKITSPAVVYLMPGGWYFQNEIEIAQDYKKWLSVAVDTSNRLARPEIKADADRYFDGWQAKPWNVFANDVVPVVGGSVLKLAYTQSCVDRARIACALERYHLALGEYPETLVSPTPKFLDKIPNDVITGQPLHYHRSADGKFVLYSVGWNGIDDGGKTVLKQSGGIETTQGDWVWPSPAN